MCRANTGNLCSIISSWSRTPPSATSPPTPLTLAARVASPPNVETHWPPLSMTRMSPGRAASIMSPTLKSSDVKSPRRPVISRIVTARPTQRVPGTTCASPSITPSNSTSSRALAMVGVARAVNFVRISSETLMLSSAMTESADLRRTPEVVSSPGLVHNRTMSGAMQDRLSISACALVAVLAALCAPGAPAHAATCADRTVQARGEPSRFEALAKAKARGNWRAQVRAMPSSRTAVRQLEHRPGSRLQVFRRQERIHMRGRGASLPGIATAQG